MEILDEFDNEYPLSISFCKLISLEEFEEQSLSYTQQCLHELYSNMEQNPRICERALRKQKQMEKEEAGLISYLKAKIFQALQGELNYSNYMGIAEMKEKVLQLRQDMQRVNNYAHVTFWTVLDCSCLLKDAWQNLLPEPDAVLPPGEKSAAAKTGKGQHPRQPWGKKHTLEGGFSRLHSKVPESPKFTMPRVFGPFPEVVDRATTSRPDVKCWWTGLTTVSQKRLLGNAPTTSQNAGSTGTKPAASVFNTPMSYKFQVGAEDDTDSEKASPGSSAKEA